MTESRSSSIPSQKIGDALVCNPLSSGTYRGIIWDIDDSLAGKKTVRLGDPIDFATEEQAREALAKGNVEQDGDKYFAVANVAVVPGDVWKAIREFNRAGGVSGVATGRRFSDLYRFSDRRPDEAADPMFTEAELQNFDFLVGEMGTMIMYPKLGKTEYANIDPETGEIVWQETIRGEIDLAIVDQLIKDGIPQDRIWPGRKLIAGKTVDKEKIQATVDRMGLHDQLVAVENGDAVNFIPPGVSKELGVQRACQRLGCNLAQTAGVGNSNSSDGPFLAVCGLQIAVANSDDKLLASTRARGEHGYITRGKADRGALEVLQEMTVALKQRQAQRSGPETGELVA